MRAVPYLMFNGNCEEAFLFYEKTFNGTIVGMHRFSGTPDSGHIPQEFQNQIMHVSLKAGDLVLLGSDDPTGSYQTPQGISVSLHVDEPAEADRIFAALAEGGNQTMPIARTFWAERFGMVVDRFGTPWMVNCDGDVAQNNAATTADAASN